MNTTNLLLVCWAVVMVVLLMTGCTTLQRDGAARLAVTYATLKTIEAGDNPSARAAEIAAIADEAQRFLGADAVTVGLLEHAVRARLPADLSPADRLLADALIVAVVAELEARAGTGVLAPEQRLVVNEVVDWISSAARAYP